MQTSVVVVVVAAVGLEELPKTVPVALVVEKNRAQGGGTEAMPVGKSIVAALVVVVVSVVERERAAAARGGLQNWH